MFVVYFILLFFIVGVFEEEIIFMNYNVSIEVCRFVVELLLLMNMYVCFLFLLMVVNLIVIVGFYVFVFKCVKFLLYVREVKCKVYRDSNVVLEIENEVMGIFEI